MKKFIALYLCPPSVLEAWAKTDPEKRKEMETKMQGEWNTWMSSHKDMIKETGGAGKTKQITGNGISNIKNNIMLYSVIEAPSHEAAAEIFKGHPHLGIPESSIEIMEANILPGMQGF